MNTLLVKAGAGYKQLMLQEEPTIIFEANEPLEFTFGKSHKTFTLTIPNVGDNNTLLDNLFYKNYSHTLVYHNVFMQVDGVFMEGVLLIYAFDRIMAEGQFIAGSGLLWENIARRSLKELDWSEYNHPLNITNVTNNSLFNGDIKYDFLYRGKGLYNDAILTEVDIAERQPAIRVKAIIDKIFEGYTINQNVWTAPQYENLYVLPVKKEINVQDKDFLGIAKVDAIAKNTISSSNINLTQSAGWIYQPILTPPNRLHNVLI